MKFLIVFAVALATVSAFDLRSAEINERNVAVPVVGPEGRITNGQNAAVGQFPYQVGLSLNDGSDIPNWCGGSLIGNEWVLTAAHCTDGIKSVTVYLGSTVRTEAEIIYTVNSSDIINHLGWDSRTIKNDISLIRIPFTTYTAKIQPIVLPAIATFYSSYTGDKVIASGWGLTSDSATSIATNLQWAYMEVISNDVCARTYYTYVTSTNICVSTIRGVATCHSDSGGPLVSESSKVQVGVTSFGSAEGCENDNPAVFTRTTSYLEWIKEHTGIYY